jgi:nitroreductase
MNVINALNSRKAVRNFIPNPVEKETLVKIMTAANRTPSWADTQPWEIFVATGDVLNGLRQAFLDKYNAGAPSQPELSIPQDWPPALKQRMAENMANRYAELGLDRNDKQARQDILRRNYEFFNAPMVIYLCMERSLTAWSIFDVGMMAQSIMLAAQEFGVGSIPAVQLVVYPELIREELGIPEELMILLGIALGYEDEDDQANKPVSLRRPVEEVVRVKGF